MRLLVVASRLPVARLVLVLASLATVAWAVRARRVKQRAVRVEPKALPEPREVPWGESPA
jgi:hypothetical protein